MIVDHYAGPGGWSEGLRMLGLVDVGIEWDRWACATRAAAGHLTIRADLATYRTPGERVTGYIASPPCQTFSTAGKGAGRAQLDVLADIIDRQAWGEADRLDVRTRHVVDTARCCVELAPRWVCLEQVPAVLPLWHQVDLMLNERGYSTWSGVLNAADYGVPQTRRRAVLIASADRRVSCPAPTHAREPRASLFGPAPEPWVTMAEALGWAGPWTLSEAQANGAVRRMDQPAMTITGSADNGNFRFEVGAESVNLTVAEALTLQSFPAGYSVQGPRSAQFLQVGNAVPPRLAMHVAAEAVGCDLNELEATS